MRRREKRWPEVLRVFERGVPKGQKVYLTGWRVDMEPGRPMRITLELQASERDPREVDQ